MTPLWPLPACLAVILLAAAGWGGSVSGDVVDVVQAVGSFAAAAALLRACLKARRRLDLRLMRAWGLFAAGFLAFGLGDAIWAYDELIRHRSTPFPSWPDWCYLAGYPALLLGASLLPTAASRRSRLRVLTDGAIIATSGFVVLWLLVQHFRSETAPGTHALANVVGVAYPVADLIVAVVCALSLLFVRKDLRAAVAVLTLGFAFLAAADGYFAVELLSNQYASGGFLDVLWPVADLVVIQAALLGPRSSEGRFERVTQALLSTVPFMGVLVAGVAGAIAWGHGVKASLPVLVAVPLGGALLVLRQLLSFRERLGLIGLLERTDSVFRSLVQGSSDISGIVGADRKLTYHSPAALRILGYPEGSLIGVDPMELVHPADRKRVADVFEGLAIAPPSPTSPPTAVACRVRTASSGWRHLEMVIADHRQDPLVDGFVVNARDVTERERLRERLTHLAYRDSLTGLENRPRLIERLEELLEAARSGTGVRGTGEIALLYLDLDGFKAVNDSFGHAAGDSVLVQVTARLRTAIGSHTIVGRLGGDEFAVILVGEQAVSESTRVAERVIEILSAPYSIANTEVIITASVGVAHSTLDMRAEELVRNGDLAMYAAKARGKSTWAGYDPLLRLKVSDTFGMEAELRLALSHGTSELKTSDLEVAYQPLLDLRTDTMIGAEALARWSSGSTGVVGPSEFVPVAERSGLILELGRQVLVLACQSAVEWGRDGGGSSVWVNVSRAQALLPVFRDQVAELLDTTGLPPARLTLEITESAWTELDSLVAPLTSLSDLGVGLAIDDFGAGVSSLSCLWLVPLTAVKIDRSLVAGLGRIASHEAITSSIVSLGRTLGMTVAAEGVETQEQLDFLRAAGCDLAQGYLVAPPMGPEDVAAALAPGATSRGGG